MKKIIAAVLCLMMLLSLAACGGAASNVEATPAEQAKAWMEKQIKNNSLFSFTYDGEEYQDHIKSWKKTVEDTEEGWNLKYVSKDGVEFTVTVKYDETHAALDWVGSFHHTGSSKSGVIGNVMMLDSDFAIADAIMTTAVEGGTIKIDGYQAYETDLVEVGTFEVKNYGGRSSQGAWPFFDITSGDDTYGIMGAIGWTGNWRATHTYADGVVNVKAGMQNTNYYMEPNETFRTPSMVIQFFKGTQDDGHNDWRQLILANYNPKDGNGDPVQYVPMTISLWGGWGSDKIIDSMNTMLATDRYIEYVWIDAGWYGDYLCDDTYDVEWGNEAGNWYLNPEGYPNGFKDIAAHAKENGYEYLVWFEPGRAVVHTKLFQEYPQYFLPNSSTNYTDMSRVHYDYGNPEALSYITDLIIGLLDDMECMFYRQDYNFDPAEGWSRKDATLDADGNRVGVSEINYVTGHYAFLDAILASGRRIDNCASGGRLIDIEMTKRSIPLHRSDYNVSAEGASSPASGIYSMGAGMSWWLVHTGGQTGSEGRRNEYGFRASMGSGLPIGTSDDAGFLKRMTEEILHNREYMLHDFYILTQGYGDETDYMNAGYEYYIPEEGRGYLVCFRPTNSEDEKTTFYLKGLVADATYVIRNADTDETHEKTGEELMTTGITVYFPRAMVSHMIYFDKK